MTTTRQTIQAFFDSLERKQGWESFLADDVVFTSLTSPVEQVTGKDACLQATRRFYSTVRAMEVRDWVGLALGHNAKAKPLARSRRR